MKNIGEKRVGYKTALFISFKYFFKSVFKSFKSLRIFYGSVASSTAHWNELKCINFSSFQNRNWNSQKSDQYSLSDEVLVLALTEGLATFVKNPIPRSKYNLAISSDFSLSLRMIPAFDLHYLIVLQTTDDFHIQNTDEPSFHIETTDEPSFLGNYFNTTFTSIGKLSPKQNLVNFTCWELWWFSPIWFVVAIL